MFPVEIPDQVAWVTGGSRGIGKAIAIGLAQAGCHVAISYRSRSDEAEAVVNQIRELGRKSVSVKMDVANAKECEDAQKLIDKELGPVTILVNSAGVTADNLFIMLGEEDWQSVVSTNLMGVVNVTKACMRGMMMKRTGRVINLSSVAATKGGRGQTNYAATKGAVEAMTRSLAVEMGSRGITANCIAPGVIETDMAAEVIKLAKDQILDRQVVKRFGKPEEVAAWAVFLASKHGEYITGQTIHIDGGLKMV